MADKTYKDDMPIGSVVEEEPVVEAPERKKVEEWVAIGPLTIPSRFCMHPAEASSTAEDLDPGMDRGGPSYLSRTKGSVRLIQVPGLPCMSSSSRKLG